MCIHFLSSVFFFCCSSHFLLVIFATVSLTITYKWIDMANERTSRENNIARRAKDPYFYLSSNSNHRVSYCQQCALHWLLHKNVSHSTESRTTTTTNKTRPILTYQCVFISYFAMTLLTRMYSDVVENQRNKHTKNKIKSNTISMPYIYYDSILYMRCVCVCVYVCSGCFLFGNHFRFVAVWLEFCTLPLFECIIE